MKRYDKWYLGGGGRLIWAPPFPHFLNRPGFWDPAHYFNIEFAPLFSWALLDEDGREMPLAGKRRTWTPASLSCRYRTPRGTSLSVNEEKFVLPFGVAAATVRLNNRTRQRRTLHLVAWTAQSGRIEGCSWSGERLEFIRRTATANRPDHPIAAAFSIDGEPSSFEAQISQGILRGPDWKITPFSESFHQGLKKRISAGGITEDGLLFIAVHAEIDLPPGGAVERTIGMALAPSHEEAGSALTLALRHPQPVELSRATWHETEAAVPSLVCSDPFITNFYRHRWYGLRLNTIAVEQGHYRHPFVCEGIGYFRAPISYSAFCHMLENRWRRTADLARGSVLTFIDNQRDDGGFRGYIDVDYHRQEMFYHAGWGRAIRELHRIHPSPQFLTSVYDPLVKYVEYFDRERDAEGTGLYDIDNHYETGQEYMRRYTAVFPDADRTNWGNVFRLKGVDVTVYLYELKQTLAWMAGLCGRREEAARWHEGADGIGRAVRERMWDPDVQMFFDIDPASGKRTGVKAAVCFYPFMTDIVRSEHLPALTRHLLNPREFLTPFPFPSSSMDDAMFSAEPLWKGMRMNCPWNGRTWPMTNSHLADALGSSAIRFHDLKLRRSTAEFISRFIRMMFFDGDPNRPNSFEHYNPLSGAPSLYRGIDDYQHSWVNDLILRYVAGVRPGDGEITIDPFPFGLERLECRRIVVAGRTLSVEIAGNSYSATVDGRVTATARIGTPTQIVVKET